MKKLFTLQKGRILLLVLMLCLGFSKVLADEDGLLYQQYPITVEKAGLLNTKIGNTKKYKLTNVKISGELNAKDIQFIREMAGCYNNTYGSKYEGHLQILDLTDASFVGSYNSFTVYDGKGYTATASLTDDKSVGSYTFSYLPNLQEIKLPSNTTAIGVSAFAGCTNLPSITLPDGLESIGSRAFQDCVGFTSFAIPSGVEVLSDGVFKGCTNLETVELPSALTSINGSAFYGCEKLVSLTIPKSVTSIGSYAFYNCKNLPTLTLPSGLKSIGGAAFSGCESMTSFVIPSGVTSIEYDTFYGCIGMTSVELPFGIAKIDNRAFYNCAQLYSFTIPLSVTSIGESAFYGCSRINSISIPSSVKSIGDYAFSGCDHLFYMYAYMTTPATVSSNTFEGIMKHCWLYVPEGLRDTYFLLDGWGEFSYIDEFDPVEKNNKIHLDKAGTLSTKIDDGWKYKVQNLTVDGDLNDDDVLYLKDLATNGELQTLDMTGAKLENLPDNAFKDCGGLKKIILPSTLKTIGNYAFFMCGGLTFVAIPEGVTSIGKMAFCQCFGLTSISLPSTLASIGETAFMNSKNITSIYAGMKSPISGKTIDSRMGGFFGAVNKDKCILYVPVGSLSAYSAAGEWNNLKNIVEFSPEFTVDNTREIAECLKDKITKLTITGELDSNDYQFLREMINDGQLQDLDLKDAKVEHLETDAFIECYRLVSLILPSCLKSIGSGAVAGCRGLTSIVVPNGVEKIGEYAFYQCDKLRFLTLPASLRTLDCGKFGSYSIEVIYANMPNPMNLYENIFCSLNLDKCILYVPNGSLEAYKSADGWKKFKNIVEMDASGIDSVILNPDAKEVSRYSVNGQRLAVPVKGLNIVKYSDGSARKVVVK